MDTQPVIFTNEARCRDCYRCVRVCPVKAIRVQKDQASVDNERCIGCGTCIRECPQNAKTYRRDIDRARAVVKGGNAAVSIAPSFAGIYEEWECRRIPSALRRLGFKYAAETAVGAYLVARETLPFIKDRDQTHICTACPAVVSYVEKYDPRQVKNLLPLVSPMMAHARHIKVVKGMDVPVVFIGPCAAKKAEAERREFKGLVDCVLTFEELEDWLKEENILIEQCEESAFDEQPCGRARLFPVEGGAMATSDMETSVIDERLLFVSGFKELKECLDLAKPESGDLIEPLFCMHGCVNGPGIVKKGNVFERRARVIRYAKTQPSGDHGQAPAPALDLSTAYKPKSVQAAVREEQIAAVLEKTGKMSPEQQLNCGACGYASCREQAMAVVQGMAGNEMCIPHMRRLAEQRSDKVIATSPNGIVILDERLNILSFNPAFDKMFHAGSGAIGKGISQLMDPDPFEKVASGELDIHDDVHTHERVGLMSRDLVYALREEKQYVGIFISLNPNGLNAEKLEKIKQETLLQAQELYEHQIEMARNIANFLGEYTARGEKLVHKLRESVEGPTDLNGR